MAALRSAKMATKHRFVKPRRSEKKLSARYEKALERAAETEKRQRSPKRTERREDRF